MQRFSRYLQAYVRVRDFVSSKMIGMQRFAIFTGISKDMGVIVCHPELLGSSVCLDIYKHMERYGSHLCHPELLEYSVCLDIY